MNKTFFLYSLLLSIFLFSCKQTPNTKITDVDSETVVSDPSTDDGQEGVASFETVVLTADIASPRKEMTGKIGEKKVVVNYGSPSVKGRQIWGDLVPYGAVWRAGANEATHITLDQDVEISGQALPKGTYGLFVLPEQDESWEVIFNEVAEQWGAYEFDASKNVVTTEVSPKMVDQKSETLEFMIENDQLILHWDTLQIPISIK